MVRDGYGQHVVRDALGNDPLRDPDPVQRLKNVHALAAAPMYRYAIAVVLEVFGRHVYSLDSREAHVIGWLGDVLHQGSPLWVDQLEAMELRGQVQLYFDEVA